MSDAIGPPPEKDTFPSTHHRFKPGQSGNPGGRPKGESLDAKLRKFLEASEIDGLKIEGGKTVGDLVVVALVKHAVGGDSAIMRYLWDRICGKTPDKIQVSGGLGIDLPEALAESLRRAYGDSDDTSEEDNETCGDSA